MKNEKNWVGSGSGVRSIVRHGCVKNRKKDSNLTTSALISYLKTESGLPIMQSSKLGRNLPAENSPGTVVTRIRLHLILTHQH